jgi:hypothetical protein
MSYVHQQFYISYQDQNCKAGLGLLDTNLHIANSGKLPGGNICVEVVDLTDSDDDNVHHGRPGDKIRGRSSRET